LEVSFMGPDLPGVVGATAVLLGVICLFALIDRVLCGAWEALNGSPGWGLVAGMAAWDRDAGVRREQRTQSSPSDGSPRSREPVAPEPVAVERVRSPSLRSGLRGPRHEMVLVPA
jgi:hypothetical protein